MLDDFSKPLDWNAHIIGLHKEAQKINIQIEGKFLNLPSLTVQLTTRVANKESGATSVTPPKLVNVPKDNAASGANHTVYRLALTIADYDYPPRGLLFWKSLRSFGQVVQAMDSSATR